MKFIRRFIYAPEAATGLCRTCTWGTVRAGFSRGESETFCRLVGPESRVRFAVRDCTDYCDRRVQVSVSDERRFGFVTEIKLESGEIRAVPEETAKPVTN